MKGLYIRPISLKDACYFINLYHRHNVAPQGCKWCLSVYKKDKMVGVAVVGRPIARHLDDGQTVEIVRVCTDGTKNACSKLYGACVRVAKDMGYKKVITYILNTEDGASCRSANFTLGAENVGGGSWNSPSRPRRDMPVTQTNLFGETKKFSLDKKKRYEYIIEG